jgi:hypothetical protein
MNNVQLGLMINSMVNPSKENMDAAMDMANAPGARK